MLFCIIICSHALAIPAITQAQSRQIPLLTSPPTTALSTSLLPGEILAGPAPLQGTSALGCCFLPNPTPWGVDAVIVVDLFLAESWAYDAVTLEPIGTVTHPVSGATTTGITTDGNFLYWGILAPPTASQLWRTNLDGSDPVQVGDIGLQVSSFVGGLAWDGDDGIWAVDIAGERYDRISSSDASYLGDTLLHPDNAGAGNGLAYRSDCGHLEIPHGSNFAGRVTTISKVNPLTDVPLAPLDVSSIGFFINGIETSRPAVAPNADPFGVYSMWIVDNSSNNLYVVEGHSDCPEELPPIDDFSCSADPDGEIIVTWQSNPNLETVEIRIDGLLVDSTSGSAGTWSGLSASFPDVILVEICGHTDQQWTPTVSCELLIPGCSEGLLHLSHLETPELINQSVPVCTDGAGHVEQSYWRIYEIGAAPFSLPGDFLLNAVQIAIENSNPGPGSTLIPILLRLYADPDGGSINPISSLTVLHQQEFLIPTLQNQHMCLNLTTPLPVGQNTSLVVEISLPDGSLDEHLLTLGANSSPETGEAWHSAPFCGIPNPVIFSGLGYPDLHIGIDLIGDPIGTPFIRGDVNGDSSRNLTDAIVLMQSLLVPGSPPLTCLNSGDSNDDGGVNLADAVFLLSYLFVPGSADLPPPEVCGVDPSPSTTLNCDLFPGCP
ncbi:MAG: dockerin type I domain-containing protein [Planctomycetota bacterium]